MKPDEKDKLSQWYPAAMKKFTGEAIPSPAYTADYAWDNVISMRIRKFTKEKQSGLLKAEGFFSFKVI